TGGVLVLSALAALTACSEKIQSAEGTVATTVSTASSAPVDSSVAPTSSAAATSTSTSSTTSTSTTSTTSTSTSSTTSTTTTTPLAPRPTATSCEQVVHIGDSTSIPLFDPTGVGGEELTMDQRYRAVGVSVVFPDNDGARAIIEHIDSDPNALEVAQ